MENIVSVLSDFKLTISSRFVPFAQSRNKSDKGFSLNWIIDVLVNGHVIFDTDYSAGIAHCPGYKVKKVPVGFRGHDYKLADGKVYSGTTSSYRAPTMSERFSQFRESLCIAECHSGFAMEYNNYGSPQFIAIKPSEPILPSVLDVFYSLVMDSYVLDYPSFSSWALEYGYNTDSIKAELNYRVCLSQAIEFKCALGGEKGLNILREVFQDY